jgi:Patatin-like phospholipase
MPDPDLPVEFCADVLPDPDLPVEFYRKVLPAEMAAIRERREKVIGLEHRDPCAIEPSPEAVDSGPKEKARQCAEAHKVRPFGLALSGGGIRSATFNLGVLQGLAERGLLPYLDYLSTVSGGGYIGAWFHGLVRSVDGQPAYAEKLLSPSEHSVPGTPDEDPITFLRKFSNYLAPDPGLFSADTWVIGFIWLRNVLLNQLVLLPAIAALVLAALLAGFLQQLPLRDFWRPFGSVALAGGVLLIVVLNMKGALQAVVERTFRKYQSSSKAGPRPGPARAVPLLAFLACVIITCLGTSADKDAGLCLALILWLLFACFQEVGGFRECFERQHEHLKGNDVYAVLNVLWMSPLAAATSWILIWEIWKWSGSVNLWMVLAFAPPLACLSIMAGASILIGLMGADYPDAAREWLSSVGSNLSMIAAAWSAFFALTVFGPWAISSFLVKYGRTASATLTTWALTTIGGVIAGRSSSTNGVTENGNLLSRFLVQVAPTLFVIGYLLFISFGVHSLIRNQEPWMARHATGGRARAVDIQLKASSNADGSDLEVKTSTVSPSWFESHLRDFADRDSYFASLDRTLRSSGVCCDLAWDTRFVYLNSLLAAIDPRHDLERTQILIGLLFLSVAIGLIASSRININEFSIHHFYKNRLVRCYMGASRGSKREPDARTGFDPQDDFPIADLQPAFPAESKTQPYFGPYAIVNTALNLNVGSELATQERKACSFFFTPKYSGYEAVQSQEDIRKFELHDPSDFQLNGYRPTRGYGAAGGPDIGTTMAISGAAANPNWGYHTSGPMAFLLTVFNVRLGWWLGNSRFTESSPTSGPRLTLKYLFMELAAQTTARTRYVNLSDGGHFENLGLYELVRRRCRYIVVGDGEQDGEFTFESLGGAIRKCRADFGVEITINPDPIRIGTNKFSSAHCVIGSILYPEPEQGMAANLADPEDGARKPSQAQGWLLYMKASLTGNEPADIAQYHSGHPEFPHESTLNQFYTESQFESYRRLGLHVVREAFADVDLDHPLLCIFQELTRKWYAPVAVTEKAAADLNGRYSELMRRLSENPNLVADFIGLLPDKPANAASTIPLSDKSFVFGTEVIQLMEDVVNTFDFEQSANFANPGLSGWAKVFQRWVLCDNFYFNVWRLAKNDYQLGFQKFIEDLRNPPPGMPPPSI